LFTRVNDDFITHIVLLYYLLNNTWYFKDGYLFIITSGAYEGTLDVTTGGQNIFAD